MLEDMLNVVSSGAMTIVVRHTNAQGSCMMEAA